MTAGRANAALAVLTTSSSRWRKLEGNWRPRSPAWRDEIGAIGRPAGVGRFAEAGADARHFEFSFGLADEDATAQRAGSVLIDGRFKLRGLSTSSCRKSAVSCDHRSQDRQNRTTARTIIGGGGTLQPVIYSLAIEKILDRRVTGGRLFYCTAAGGFTEHPVALSEANRRAGLEALEIIDRAIELGFLPPAPAERACAWCDFRPVCGPDEAEHARRKPADSLGDLTALREMP